MAYKYPAFKMREGDKHGSLTNRPFFKGLRAAFMNHAILRVIGLNPSAITDSSGGTADTTNFILAAATIPSLYSSGATDKAPKAGFDTAVAAIYNDQITVAAWINTVRVSLGLSAITYTGSPGTAGTLTAVTTALTAVTGTTVCVEDASAITQMKNLLANNSVLLDAVNETLAAINSATGIVDNNASKTVYTPLAITATAATATGVAGTDNTTNASLKNTDVVAFLASVVSSVSTIAAAANKLSGVTHANTPLAGVYIGGN